jgi:hypothetical protein
MGWAGRGRGALWVACLAGLALPGAAGCAPGSSGTVAARVCSSAPGTAAAGGLPPQLMSVSAAPGTRQAWALGQFVMPARGLVFYLVHFSGLYWAKAVTFAPEFQLDGVSAVSGNVAWLWGSDQPAGLASLRPLLALVSGGVVRQVHQAFLKNVYIWGLASDGAADAWLVGGARDRHGRFEGVVAARWDGTSWHQVPAPAGVAGSASDGLTSLSISGRSDAWVVSRPVPVKPRLLHWDGVTWSRSYAPPASLSRSGSVPSGMSVASSPGHAWVVYGDGVDNSGSNGPAGPPPRPFSAYFDGSTWRRYVVPTGFSSLTGVTMAGGDAWAAGKLHNDNPEILYSHLGSGWCVQPLPRPRCNPVSSSISAASPTYVIAVSPCYAYVYTGHRWRSARPHPASRAA